MTDLALDIIVDSPLWNTVAGLKPTLRRAIKAAALPTGIPESELAIVLTDDDAIRELNRQWRGRDEPTNVLSFPTNDARTQHAGPRLLGDVVIAYETTTREAQAQGLPLNHHLAHLAVHGYLHLLGYDHESEKEAEIMERLEREILARLDVPDPYATLGEV
jgi:probable rRNA maturation factor